jgi:hypothetical protein
VRVRESIEEAERERERELREFGRGRRESLREMREMEA